jgi:hypothetical protein
MYDGTEYQSKGNHIKINRSSVGGMKQPYMKPGFWEQNQFWENDSYTDKGKQHCRNVLLKEERNRKADFIGKS